MTADQLESETFSSVDTAWLHMDRPTNLANITGVIIFAEPLPFERLKTTVESRLLLYKRFRQRVVEPPHPTIQRPRWETDPDFNLDNHLVRVSFSAPLNTAMLQRLVGEMMSIPLDRAKPLWQFHFIERYDQGSALICRLHHCIADGIALVQVLLSITSEQPDTTWPEPPAEEPQHELSRLAKLLRPAVKTAMAAGSALRMTEEVLQTGIDTIIYPPRLAGATQQGADALRALAKLLLIPPDHKTVLRGKCDIPKLAVWSQPLDLEQFKGIGQKMGGTLNDILLSAVTGALRRYLEERGEEVIGLDIRTIVPVNLRPPDDVYLVGNRFGLVFLSLPVGIIDPIERLLVLKRRMNEIKDSPEAVVALGILGAVGMTSTQIEKIIVDIFGVKGSAVMTNVPGPRKPLYMAGSRIRSLMCWVPTPASLSLGLSIVSYAETVSIGLATDAGLIPDPERIIDHFYAELEFLQQWGRPTAEEPASSQEAQSLAPPEPTESPARCQALTKEGKSCKNRALPGSAFCFVHKDS
jgi:WS/DGAT/MGAT family acyltransferase